MNQNSNDSSLVCSLFKLPLLKINPHILCTPHFTIKFHSAGIFKEGRLIIVMNKLDQITSGEDIRKKVCEYIQDKVCRCEAKDIPREAVIPVYGKWAFEARMLAGDQSNDRRKETVARILSQRSSQPFGQGEDCGKVLAEKPSEDLAKELEQISNITILERRYDLLQSLPILYINFI